MSNTKYLATAFETHDQVEESLRSRQKGGFDTNQIRTDVLIADPDIKLCRSYERMFSASGLRVVTAGNGLDCWMKLRASSPDALMVDLDLLWGGSAGVLVRLQEEPDGKTNPEVFVTGNDTPEVLSNRSGIAVERCFQKPLELGMVLDSICDVFSGDPEITFSGEWV